MNLRTKVPLLIAILVSATLLVSGAVTYSFSSELLLRKSKDEIRANAFRTGEAIHELVTAEIRKTEILASQSLFRDVLEARSVRGDETFFASDHPAFASATQALRDAFEGSANHEKYWLGDPNGVVIASSETIPETGGIRVADRDYFLKAMAGRPGISDTIVSRANGKTIIAVAAPVRDASGTVSGVVGNSIYTSFFSEHLKGIRINDRGKLYIVDSVGTILAHSTDESLVHTDVGLARVHELLKEATALDVVNGGEEIEDGGTEKYIAYSRLALTGWMVVVEDDIDDIRSPLRELAGSFVAVLLSSIAGSVLLFVTILYQWVTRPLQRILRVIAKARKGDLQARVGAAGKDEFGALGNALNEMLDEISTLLRAREEANRLELENVAERERNRRSELLRKLMYKLTSTLDPEEVQRLAFEELQSLVPFARATVWRHTDAGYVPEAQSGDGGRSPQVDPAEVREWVDRIAVNGQAIAMARGRANTYGIAVPLVLNEMFYGALILEREEADFDDNDAELLLGFCSQAIIAVYNAILYRQKEQLSVTDELTGMCNRRHFYQLAQRAAEGAEANGEPLSVVLFDIDRFKQINDRFGHFVGDRVLESLSEAIAGALPPSRVVARFGGEEFALLLPGFGGEAAAKVAEAVRANVERFAFDAGVDGLGVTVSLGVAERAPEEGLQALLRRADAALYEAKRQGRNRVVGA